MHRRSLITSAAAAAVAAGGLRRARPIGPPSLAGPVDLLLVLAVDMSGSISQEEARLQSEGYRSALVDPAVLAAVRAGPHGAVGIAYAEWAGPGFQRLLLPWTRIADHADAEAWTARLGVASPSPAIIASAASGGGDLVSGTSIADGIAFSLETLAKAPWEAARRTIDVSGDGMDNSGRSASVEGARDRAIREGITINGLTIEGDPEVRNALGPGGRLADYYRAFVVGGPGAFVIAADGFADFRDAVRRKLIREIAAPVTAPWLG